MTTNFDLGFLIARKPFDESVPFFSQTPTFVFYYSHCCLDRTISHLGRCDKKFRKGARAEQRAARSRFCHGIIPYVCIYQAKSLFDVCNAQMSLMETCGSIFLIASLPVRASIFPLCVNSIGMYLWLEPAVSLCCTSTY